MAVHLHAKVRKTVDAVLRLVDAGHKTELSVAAQWRRGKTPEQVMREKAMADGWATDSADGSGDCRKSISHPTAWLICAHTPQSCLKLPAGSVLSVAGRENGHPGPGRKPATSKLLLPFSFPCANTSAPSRPVPIGIGNGLPSSVPRLMLMDLTPARPSGTASARLPRTPTKGGRHARGPAPPVERPPPPRLARPLAEPLEYIIRRLPTGHRACPSTDRKYDSALLPQVTRPSSHEGTCGASLTRA